MKVTHEVERDDVARLIMVSMVNQQGHENSVLSKAGHNKWPKDNLYPEHVYVSYGNGVWLNVELGNGQCFRAKIEETDV